MTASLPYRHTQVGYLTIASLAAGLVVVGLVAWSAPPAWPMPALVVGFVEVLLAACLVLFCTLTVCVDTQAVRVRFGLGLISRTVPLASIRSCRPVRTPWYWGWGIRLIPGGWMFNVSGSVAVELELATGRRFRIGTDEPEALAAAISAALTAAPTTT